MILPKYLLFLLVVLLFFILFLGLISPLVVVFIAIFLAALYVAAAVVVGYLNGQTLYHFQQLNRQLNLELKVKPGDFLNIKWIYPMLTGFFMDRFLRVYVAERKQGEKTIPYMRIELDALNYGKTFEIKTETLQIKYQKLFKKSDIITGDKAFDAQFFITSSMDADAKRRAAYVNSILDVEIRKQLLDRSFWHLGTLKLSQSIMEYEEEGVMNTERERKRIENIITAMYMIAKRMDMLRKQGKL